MGLINATIRVGMLASQKMDLEYKIMVITQAQMNLSQSVQDLMQVGTDYTDPDSQAAKILKQREQAEREAAEAKAKEEEIKEQERKEKEEAKARKSASGSFKKSLFGSILGTAVTYFAKTVAQQMAKKITGSTRSTTTRTTSTRKKKTTTKKR